MTNSNLSRYLNDGSNDAPKLRIYLNLDNLAELRSESIFPAGLLQDGTALSARLAADGFDGVQLTDPGPPPAGLTLAYCGIDRINTPADADPVVGRHAERGDSCLTVHVGWGLEDEDAAVRLVDAVLAASDRHRLPVFIETHRATITQDMWRTVQIARRCPEVRFNGDFSHYYCGQEMVYGGMPMKLDFLSPVFERTGFLHGRIASPGCMQMPIDATFRDRPQHATGEVDYLDDFRTLWTHAMRGFLGSAGPGDVLVFAPELLSGRYYYARLFQNAGGEFVEETDRFAQALIYRDLARACFASAQNAKPKEL